MNSILFQRLARAAASPLVGWAIAAAAVAVGYAVYGWPGVALAFSIVVFWLLLQFSRALRVMRKAADRPIGHIDNAVMLQARLQPGMRMLQVVALTRSLGQKVSDRPEVFVWRDDGGDAVHVTLDNGCISALRLERAVGTPTGA